MYICAVLRHFVRICHRVEYMTSIAIVGCGLIGTSIALGLHSHAARVYLADKDAEHLAKAQAMSGAATWRGEKVDLIVVAVDPAATADVVIDVVKVNPGTAITDVASVKQQISAAIVGTPAAQVFVAGHPIAGRQTSGPGAAHADLFKDRPWVLIDDSATQEWVREAVLMLPRALGARPVWMGAQEHDAVLAVTSHLPQVAASAVAAALLDLSPPERARVSGAGLASVTRLAASDPKLWAQILRANVDAVAPVLRQVAAELSIAADALEQADDAAVADLLRRGVDGRALLGIDEGDAAPGS